MSEIIIKHAYINKLPPVVKQVDVSTTFII